MSIRSLGRHTEQAEKVSTARHKPEPKENVHNKRITGGDECASWAVMLQLLAQYTSHTPHKHTGPQEQWLILEEKKAPNRYKLDQTQQKDDL